MKLKLLKNKKGTQPSQMRRAVRNVVVKKKKKSPNDSSSPYYKILMNPITASLTGTENPIRCTTSMIGLSVSATNGAASTLTGVTEGYIVWYPEYHHLNTIPTASIAQQTGNMFVVKGSGLGDYDNTTAAPAFSSATSRMYEINAKDPIGNLMSVNSQFKTALTLGAQIDVRYVGTELNRQGEFAFIDNLSTEQFLGLSNGSIPTVDQIFARSRGRDRITDRDMSVKSCLNEPKYHTYGRATNSTVSQTYGDGIPNSLLEAGLAAGFPTRPFSAESSNSPGFGFAWRNLNADNLVFDFTKVVSMRYAPTGGGFVETLNDDVDVDSRVRRAVLTAIKRDPNFQNRQHMVGGTSRSSDSLKLTGIGPIQTAAHIDSTIHHQHSNDDEVTQALHRLRLENQAEIQKLDRALDNESYIDIAHEYAKEIYNRLPNHKDVRAVYDATNKAIQIGTQVYKLVSPVSDALIAA